MRYILILFSCIFLQGCGGNDIAEDRPKTGVIVVFGDSITKGHGVGTGQGYVDLLGHRLQNSAFKSYRVVNLGITRDKTSDGIARIKTVLDENPEIVILALGGNDFLQRKTIQEIDSNFRVIIQAIKKTKADILLVGVTAPPTRGFGYIGEAKRMYKSLAKAFDLAFMPNILKGILLDQRYMQSDRVHPNGAGHIKISENMWEYLTPLLRSK